jgi:hypothetical protein
MRLSIGAPKKHKVRPPCLNQKEMAEMIGLSEWAMGEILGNKDLSLPLANLPQKARSDKYRTLSDINNWLKRSDVISAVELAKSRIRK